MDDFSRDPVNNAINDGIRRGIEVAIDNDCFGPAVILIYTGIDAMAYISMREDKEDVARQDFIDWVDTYIRFPCESQITGLDAYGARCGMLHNYSVFSKITREGKCRKLAYVDQSLPEVIYDPSISESLAVVSIRGLAQAFFNGIDKCLIDIFTHKQRAKLAEDRLKGMTLCMPRQESEE